MPNINNLSIDVLQAKKDLLTDYRTFFIEKNNRLYKEANIPTSNLTINAEDAEEMASLDKFIKDLESIIHTLRVESLVQHFLTFQNDAVNDILNIAAYKYYELNNNDRFIEVMTHSAKYLEDEMIKDNIFLDTDYYNNDKQLLGMLKLNLIDQRTYQKYFQAYLYLVTYINFEDTHNKTLKPSNKQDI